MAVSTPLFVPTVPMRRQWGRGFTAIELMVVVAIVAILGALAGPSFRDLIDGWRVRSGVEQITSSIYYARSEAIKRGGGVSVRKNCAGTVQEWQCGWIVFTDANSNGAQNAGDEILQTFPEAPGVIINHLRNPSSAFYTLDRWGQIAGLGAASFNVVPDPVGVSSRHTSVVCVTSGGRIETKKGSAAC